MSCTRRANIDFPEMPTQMKEYMRHFSAAHHASRELHKREEILQTLFETACIQKAHSASTGTR
jgi:hypothetical protein